MNDNAPPVAPSISVPAPRSPVRPLSVLLALPPSTTSVSLGRGLRQDLAAEGVDLTVAADGIELLDAVRAGGTDLLVLDMDLPGPDPAVLLGAVQAESPPTPVITVVPRERRATVLGLLRGDRDDFLIRPFVPDELAARIRLRLRAAAGLPAPTVLGHGGLSVDVDAGQVFADGRRVALSPTEYALLLALAERAGEVVTHDELARRAWSEPASPNLVQVYISYLRRKIGPERIRTVRGAGYQLDG
ncbi:MULTISPECIES: response regulator transcription factor [unclassified Pseudonocardia]|uniref:response regulator transcription factor n=1 Tax=unclassified Pseudonocardia TaxID=2619320 RepID=UPI0001FFE4EE|nr:MULTISPECIES: response regulator transcription factor [unclassified Pseudonocardia]ALE75399.1 DNA-binding protein [Pseudonocardia sp. EC080625-04]ALL74765.1 DNA-binding protein [Pseudonocardia sp. EC080610-09]ALL81788.1 DNA-binding protein [Pseudonocardia sp. EC080619-01]OLM15889.1 DNA-binding heavy metal response regulator [Pseudonocardia sp. Ae707_Ps1]